jgi:cyclopropane fatty-acyl-phospholipid synthase-like methyltransferase
VSQSTNAWDKIFEQQGQVFIEPHEDMPGIVRLLKVRQAKTILDLGCGSGRHTVYLARQGFSVYSLDNSPRGIELTHQWLADEGLQADLALGSMTQRLPYADAFFDAVVSVQVIHHATLATIIGIVHEIFRVLKTGGLVFVTVTMLRHYTGPVEELEPNTFVPLAGPEKGLPHHCFTPEELREVFEAFEISGIHVDKTEHYCLLASKP